MEKPKTPEIALIPSRKGGNFGINVMVQNHVPREFGRYVHEHAFARWREIVKGAPLHPMPNVPEFQQRLEEMNPSTAEILGREVLYDLLGRAYEVMEEAIDKGWLRVELDALVFDKGGKVIHVDFGRKS